MLDAMQTQQQQLAQDFEAESAELSLLEAHVLESACDDPGALLLPHLILPYLRKRWKLKQHISVLQQMQDQQVVAG